MASKLKLMTGKDGARVVRDFATNEGAGWPAVAGTVRPATPQEVEAHYAALSSADGFRRTGIKARFYADHLVSWDVVGEDGQPAPVAPQTLMSLPYPVWLQLDEIVLGILGGDILGESEPS